MVFQRPAMAGPNGGQVVAGSASISQSGSTTNVNQSSQSTIINWQSFSIAPKETVNFNQPNSAAVALNRVVGNETSVIAGALNANGRVFIVNSAGVIFSKEAQVNVGGLVASTLDISNTDFMAGNYTFSGTSGASVINHGNIHAGPGGYVALLGKTVVNDGVISARLGTVAMASGQQITLNFGGDSLVDVTIDQGTLNALVANHRAIKADGGQVIMTAKAADEVLSAQVNNTGIIQARTIASLTGGGSGAQVHVGKIKLVAVGGTTNVAGTLDASAPNGGNGGSIETSGDHVKIADGAVIKTSAATGRGGTWLIDPTDFNIVAGSGSQTTSGIGAATLDSNLNSAGNGNIVLATAAGGSGNGDINVDAAVSWSSNATLTLNAANNININAPITATGTNAGLALNYGGTNGNTAVTPVAGANYNILTPASFAGTVPGANGLPVAQTDTSGGVYGSVTLSGSNSALAVNGTNYTLIRSMAALPGINNVTGHYALAQSLEASGTPFTNYTVVPTLAAGSTFAGLGNTIDGLTITGTTGAFGQVAGLFGTVRSSTIRDLGLTNVNINVSLPTANAGATSSVGALAGFITVTGTAPSVVFDVYGTGTILAVKQDPVTHQAIQGTGFGNVGGLIGRDFGNSNTSVVNTVTDAFARMTVAADPGIGGAGGLIGSTNSAILTNTDTTGVDAMGNPLTVTGQKAGGLVDGVANGQVFNSYSTLNVIGSGGGLLAGFSGPTTGGTVANSFATGNVTGVVDNGGLIGTVGFSNGNVTLSNDYATGNVSANSTTAQGGETGEGGLVGVATNNGANFHLTVNNVHATGTVTVSSVGTADTGAGGLFGVLDDGTSGSSVANSFATGNVFAPNINNVGGFVGDATNTNISGSSAAGNVTGNDMVGGFAGSFDGGSFTPTISSSFSTGTVTATHPSSGSPAVGNFVGKASFAKFKNDGALQNKVDPNIGNISVGTSPISDGSQSLNAEQARDAAFYANGTIGQVLAGRAAATQTGSAVANGDPTTSATGGPGGGRGNNPGGGGNNGTGSGSGDLTGRLLDSNIQYQNAPTSNNQRHRRTASNHPGDRGGNVGATIRTIEINGQRFNLRGGSGNGNTPPNNGH